MSAAATVVAVVAEGSVEGVWSLGVFTGVGSVRESLLGVADESDGNDVRLTEWSRLEASWVLGVADEPRAEVLRAGEG